MSLCLERPQIMQEFFAMLVQSGAPEATFDVLFDKLTNVTADVESASGE